MDHVGRLNGTVPVFALIAVQIGVAVVTLDISLTSTALPTIAHGIGASPAGAIWMINSYYLAVVAALLPLAALGEIYGHSRVFRAGLGVFAAGCFASSLSSSLPAIAVARGLVGVGAAAVSATTPALIRALYPPERLGRGLGLYALVVGVAFSVGPTAASAILSVLPWPWLFGIDVPLAIAALALAWRGLPETARQVRAFDGTAAAICAGAFASLLFGIAGVAHGADVRPVLLAFGVAAGCGWALRRREAGRAAPILAVDLFRNPLFALSSFTSVCAFTIQGLVFVVLPFLFQFRLGYSPVQAGFLITPWPATLTAVTLVAGPLGDRVPPGLLGGGGLLAVACGAASLAALPAAPGVGEITWRLMLCGAGFGFFQSPNMRAIMGSAPASRSGGASGILAASRLFGQSVGAAVVAVSLSLSPERGVEIALLVAAGVGLVGSAVSLTRLLPAVRGSH